MCGSKHLTRLVSVFISENQWFNSRFQVERFATFRSCVSSLQFLYSPPAMSAFPRPVIVVIFAAFLCRLHAQEYDVVIRHARIIDGTGVPAVRGDIALRADRIAAVGSVSGRGRTEIDAQGRVAAPGFIDVHTHSENITENPLAENFLRMGVTTIVAGNCGRSELNLADFLDRLRKLSIGVNFATLIGHNTIRGQVMGGSFARPPTAKELEQMCDLVERAMKDGAVGLSTGLHYIPGAFARSDEVIALAKVAARHGGIYASHMRHETAKIRSAIEELVTIAREAHIRAHISHIKLSGPTAWGQADEILTYLDRVRADGVTLTHDQYVYTASSTGIGSNLIDEKYREGGTQRFRARLADPATKALMVADMKSQVTRGQRGDYAYAVIASFEPDRRLNGKTIPQAAKLLRGNATLDDQIETILDLEARGGADGVFHGISEADLRVFLAHPLTMFASDSAVRRFGEAVPHPRGYGNNPRVLGRYVREQKIISLEEAVRKMSSLPARTFHLQQRGELKPGFVADVVIFDPEQVTDVATYDDPHHYAAGFSDIIVNGVPVIRRGELTGARPGRPVKLHD